MFSWQPRDPKPFPLWRLHADFRRLIEAINSDTGAADSLIFASLMTIMALSVQRISNVQPAPGYVFPLSHFFVTVTASGEGKSPVDRITSHPVKETQDQLRRTYQEEYADYKRKSHLHRVETKRLEALHLRTKTKEDADRISELLEDHLSSLPMAPVATEWLLSRVTPEALRVSLSGEYKSAAIVSSEPSGIFDGPIMRQMDVLNEMWDGDESTDNVLSRESAHAKHPRLSMGLLGHPKKANDFIAKKGDEARDIGLFARIWWSWPPTVVGYREIRRSDVPSEEVTHYWALARKFLLESVAMDKEKVAPRLLTFSHSARLAWEDEARAVEKDMRPGGLLEPIKDFASKFMPKVARMAAVMHFYSNQEGDVISLETLNSASAIGAWYMNQFIDNFVGPSQEELDADELGRRLQARTYHRDLPSVKKVELRQNAPRYLRNDYDRFNRALQVLEQRGHARIDAEYDFRKRRETEYVMPIDGPWWNA